MPGVRICVVGASGKLGRYMVQHALDRGYQVVAVCREISTVKLESFGRITIIPGATDDRRVIEQAVAGCDAVLTVLVPRGVHHYASGTAQAVLDHARPGARLVFCAASTSPVTAETSTPGRSRHWSAWWDAWRASSVSSTSTTRSRRAVGSSKVAHSGPWYEAATSRKVKPQGLPVWSRHAGDPILARATAPGGWTSPGSSWRPSTTTSWFMRRRRSSAA